MLVLPSRLMCSLGEPEILLPVGAENTTVVCDEVGGVEELEFALGIFENDAAG